MCIFTRWILDTARSFRHEPRRTPFSAAAIESRDGRTPQSGRVQGSRESSLAAAVGTVATIDAGVRQEAHRSRSSVFELKRELFGPKADRLTPEQQDQLFRPNQDLESEAQCLDAASDGVLDEDEEDEKKQEFRRSKRCRGCGMISERIGEEITEVIDFILAKLINRRIVRPKHACRCGEAGETIAPLPPRLVPQSRFGLGLAVHVVQARCDDHLSLNRLE
jgi:hypothetical protein